MQGGRRIRASGRRTLPGMNDGVRRVEHSAFGRLKPDDKDDIGDDDLSSSPDCVLASRS